MLWRPALASARWPGGAVPRGGSGRTTIGVFAALQLLLLSARPWAFLLPPPPGLGQALPSPWLPYQHQHQHQRRAASTARPAFYTDDGLLPRMPPRDWVGGDVCVWVCFNA